MGYSNAQFQCDRCRFVSHALIPNGRARPHDGGSDIDIAYSSSRDTSEIRMHNYFTLCKECTKAFGAWMKVDINS